MGSDEKDVMDSNGAEDEQPEEVKPRGRSKSPKKKKKQKQKEELKSKNTGVGLKISINSDTSSNRKKIVFGDDEDFDDIPPVADVESDVKAIENKEDNKSDEDEDDDAIEEVKGDAAREEILEQLKTEERQSLKTKKKKKRKERLSKREEEEEDSEDEEDFDDDFFEQLESAKKESDEKESLRPKGKKTTFVFQDEDGEGRESTRDVDDNIQVVVLQKDADEANDAITSVPTNALSDAALQYSRRNIADGSDDPKAKKRKRPEESTWKRSRKMNLVAMSKFKRTGARGIRFR